MFKDKLKELREKEGLSQQELADKLYVSRSAVAKWENGNGIPSDVNLDSICKFFDVDKKCLQLKKEDIKYTQRQKYNFLKHLIYIVILDIIVLFVAIFFIIDAYKKKQDYYDEINFFPNSVLLKKSSVFDMNEENIQILKERFDYVNLITNIDFEAEIKKEDNKGLRQKITIKPMNSCFIDTGVIAIYDINGIVVERAPQKIKLLYGKTFNDSSDKYEIVIDLDTALICFEKEDCVGEYLETNYGTFKVIGVVSNTKERQILKEHEGKEIERIYPVTGYISYKLVDEIIENLKYPESIDKNINQIIISDENKSANEIENIIEILFNLPNDPHMYTIQTKEKLFLYATYEINKATTILYIISSVILLVGIAGGIFIIKVFNEYKKIKLLKI